MKHLLAVVLITVCFSCTTDDVEEKRNQFKLKNSPQKWELTAITSYWPASAPLTGDNLEWQEFYIFHPDSTFLKSREYKDGTNSQATGSYTVNDSSGETYIDLLFTTGEELRASCSVEERISIRRNLLLNGSWVPCDGPSFEYRLSEE